MAVHALPGKLDGWFRPGSAFTLTLAWPTAHLSSHTYTATLGGQSLTVAEVDAQTMTVTASAVTTALLTGERYQLVVTEATAGDKLAGWWRTTTDGYPHGDSASGTVVIDDIDVTVSILGSTHGTAPVVTERTAGDIAVTNTSNLWVDLDPLGTAAARPLDVVISGVTAGQWVRLEVHGLYNAGSGVMKLDGYTVVAGAPVNPISANTTGGVAGWSAVLSTFTRIAGGHSYQVVAGDIEDGAVRLRLRYRTDNSRSIFGSTGFPMRIEGSGPFG